MNGKRVPGGNGVRPGMVLCVLALGCAAITAGSAEKLTTDVGLKPDACTIHYEGKPLMVYAFDPQKYKPYIKELNTIAGYGVLRDAPFDHLHHHALMYGIRVNGINFWEEISGSGVQKVIDPGTRWEVLKSKTGLPQAKLTQLIYWVAPEDAFLPNTNTPALLIERRTITFTVDEKAKETAVQWNSAFEVGPKTNTVTLTGANYHGLGMRFLQELDAVATHFTSAGNPDLSNNRQDVATHAWEAVAFNAPGKPATIAVFGAGSNVRGEPNFFAMKTPFAYLSATQGLDREPLVYHKGERFELNYLVALWPEMKTAAAVEERGKRWEKENR